MPWSSTIIKSAPGRKGEQHKWREREQKTEKGDIQGERERYRERKKALELNNDSERNSERKDFGANLDVITQI